MVVLRKTNQKTPQAIQQQQKADARKTLAAKAATQTVTSAVAAAPTSTAVAVVPTVNKAALQLELGNMIAEAIVQTTKLDAELRAGKADYNKRDYALNAMLTAGFVKMTRADPNIDLTVVLGKEQAAKDELYKKGYLCFGLKQAQLRGKTGKEETVFDWTPNSPVSKVFAGSDKDDADVKGQKKTYITNLQTRLKTAAKAAVWLVETEGVTFKHDKDSGTLMLSGPAILKAYGSPAVLLNQSIEQASRDNEGNDTGAKTKLKVKPSFTDLGRRAAESRGIVRMPGASTHIKEFADKHVMVVHASDNYVKMLEKYDDPNDAAIAAMESVRNAIEQIIG